MAGTGKQQIGGRRTTGQPARSRRRTAQIAITVRLDVDQVRRLQAIAEAENRSLTNFVETTLLRDLSRRDEAARVITMYVAPGTRRTIRHDDVVRAEGESDQSYAERQALLVELWSIPDSE